MPNNQFFWYTRIFKTENIISQNYALKLAHLFYLLINYNLYVITTSQDCETFFLYNFGDGIPFGDFFVKSTHADKTKLTAITTYF